MQNTYDYDVVIVGGGITGSIIAKELAPTGASILILEAGPGHDFQFDHYEYYNNTFYKANAKTPNSPYPDSKFAPAPSVLDLEPIPSGEISDRGYFVQKGPFPFLSNYNRNLGGTTLHWLGTCLRMCPNDFKMKSTYNQGVNWPVKYKDMQYYYRLAENEIGVTGEVDEQTILGITFEPGYVFPMHKIPQSYLDQYLTKRLKGMTTEFNGETYDVNVVSTPQGRNGMPNQDYVNERTKEKGFKPVGAVGAPDLGQRCEGNSNCVPICPVQAKYNALKTLQVAKEYENVEILSQAVVSIIEIDTDHAAEGRVKAVHYKTYETAADGTRTNIKSHTVSGRVVVLAANAIENAKILLASNAGNSSDQVGRNLMDHLVMITWGTMPDEIGAYRGPGSTSGIPVSRDGSFRTTRSAFRIEIGNWGWTWPAFSPDSDVMEAVDMDNMFGEELRDFLHHRTSRQFRIGWEIEQLPGANNRVTIDPEYRDDLGNYRPVITYDLNDYEKEGVKVAKELSNRVFQRLGVKEFTVYHPTDPGYFEYEGMGYTVNGAGHVVGCHRMGNDPATSVVDAHQRSHDHPNLYVAGCGSFPTLATSNPTLTMAALAFKTAEHIIESLR